MNEKKITALLGRIGPPNDNPNLMNDDGHLVDRNFQDLAENFNNLTEGTAEEISPEQFQQRITALLQKMTLQLRKHGYQVIFEKK